MQIKMLHCSTECVHILKGCLGEKSKPVFSGLVCIVHMYRILLAHVLLHLKVSFAFCRRLRKNNWNLLEEEKGKQKTRVKVVKVKLEDFFVMEYLLIEVQFIRQHLFGNESFVKVPTSCNNIIYLCGWFQLTLSLSIVSNTFKGAHLTFVVQLDKGTTWMFF